MHTVAGSETDQLLSKVEYLRDAEVYARSPGDADSLAATYLNTTLQYGHTVRNA